MRQDTSSLENGFSKDDVWHELTHSVAIDVLVLSRLSSVGYSQVDMMG